MLFVSVEDFVPLEAHSDLSTKHEGLKIGFILSRFIQRYAPPSLARFIRAIMNGLIDYSLVELISVLW